MATRPNLARSPILIRFRRSAITTGGAWPMDTTRSFSPTRSTSACFPQPRDGGAAREWDTNEGSIRPADRAVHRSGHEAEGPRQTVVRVRARLSPRRWCGHLRARSPGRTRRRSQIGGQRHIKKSYRILLRQKNEGTQKLSELGPHERKDTMSDENVIKTKSGDPQNGNINRRNILLGGTTLAAASALTAAAPTQVAQAQPRPATTPAPAGGKPNILMIMADDIGWFNVSAYNHGIMGYRTPNIDRIAKEGAMFTDWYGEQSCTAGRAAFVTGQSPIRTGLTKVGLPGADIGLRAEDMSVAEALKPLGYATGQFGKNHLGDRNEFLPTVHGFDEFFGNLYHLNAEEEPQNPDYPKDPRFRAKFGPRGVLKMQGKRRRRSDGRSGLRQGRQAGHREYRTARHQTHGNGRRGVPRRRARFHRPEDRGEHALVLLLQSDAHACLDASETGIARQDRPRPLSRRHG